MSSNNAQVEADYRVQFNAALAKVYRPGSMETGVIECHGMINNNAGDAKMLRIMIGALTDKSILSHSTEFRNYTAMGFHAAMFGYLASVYKTQLLDPLDRPPSTTKTF